MIPVYAELDDGTEIDAMCVVLAGERARIAAVDARANGHHVTRPGQLSAAERRAVSLELGLPLEGEAGETPRLSTREAAVLLGVSRQVALRYVRRGVLIARRGGGANGRGWMIPRRMVEALARHVERGGDPYQWNPPQNDDAGDDD